MKNTLKKLLGYKYLVIEREVIPIFTDRVNRSNKIWRLDNIENKDIDNNLETQDGKPIYIKKNFEGTGKGCIFNKDFTKKGFHFGQKLHFKNQGFLGNISSIKKVVLVTDKYVYTQMKKGSIVSSYNYKELEKMIDFRMLEIKND